MRKQKKNFREQGITLVALVVTIIVLLVLAGVTVSMVLNNNGIIERSKSAKQEYEVSSQKEQNSLNEVGTYLESINSTPKAPFDPANVTEIGTAVCSKEDIGKTIVDKSTKEPVNVAYKMNSTTVNSTWKLLYKDSNYTYIIADNATGDVSLKSSYTGTVNIEANLRFLNKKWFDKLNGTESTRDRDKGVAFLMDQARWNSDFENAEYVVGAPTMDLISASYNLVSDTKRQSTANEGGYVVEDEFGNEKNVFSVELGNGAIFGGYDQWIASPSTWNYNYVCFIDSDYKNKRFKDWWYTCAVRPVVLIPTSEFNYDLQ